MIIAAAIGFVGLFLIVMGIMLIVKKRRLLKFGVKTKGVVVGIVKKSDSDSTTYRPEVEFKDHSGEKIRFTGSIGHGGTGLLPEIGDRVEVLYDPETKKIDLARNVQFGKFGLIFPGFWSHHWRWHYLSWNKRSHSGQSQPRLAPYEWQGGHLIN